MLVNIVKFVRKGCCIIGLLGMGMGAYSSLSGIGVNGTESREELVEYYPGILRVPMKHEYSLTQEGKKYEKLFVEELERDIEGAIRRYDELPETHGGRVVDMDIARFLYKPYRNDVDFRGRYILATQKPASHFYDYLFKHKVMNVNKEKGEGTLYVVLGGIGAGKSTFIYEMMRHGGDEIDLVMEGVGSNYEITEEKINFALRYGFAVKVVYVYRDIESAMEGVLERGFLEGRFVSGEKIARSHYLVHQNIGRLYELHKDKNEKIEFMVVVNDGTHFRDYKNNEKDLTVLSNKEYSHDEYNEVLQRVLNTSKKAERDVHSQNGIRILDRFWNQMEEWGVMLEYLVLGGTQVAGVLE